MHRDIVGLHSRWTGSEFIYEMTLPSGKVISCSQAAFRAAWSDLAHSGPKEVRDMPGFGIYRMDWSA